MKLEKLERVEGEDHFVPVTWWTVMRRHNWVLWRVRLALQQKADELAPRRLP